MELSKILEIGLANTELGTLSVNDTYHYTGESKSLNSKHIKSSPIIKIVMAQNWFNVSRF